MAKKNLHSLMSGIIGDNNNQDINDSVEPQLSANDDSVGTTLSTTRKRGRPKKNTGEIKTTATTLAIYPELLRKIKYISLVENSPLKDIVDDALSLYVSNWEKENGEIRLPKK